MKYKRAAIDFQHFSWVEPNESGDPIGPKGALGAGSNGESDSLSLSLAYCRQIEKEYVKLVRRLRHLAGAKNTDLSLDDNKIDPILRSTIVNLYNDLTYMHDKLQKLKN